MLKLVLWDTGFYPGCGTYFLGIGFNGIRLVLVVIVAGRIEPLKSFCGCYERYSSVLKTAACLVVGLKGDLVMCHLMTHRHLSRLKIKCVLLCLCANEMVLTLSSLLWSD